MDINKENKKIAVNTIIVYLRIFMSLVIGLITSRFVLKALGASDYGLYNVVGGVIAMFTFISGSLSATTTRFLNYEMGKEEGDTNRVFNISNTLHISFSAILLMLLEVVGMFYITNYLNVEQGKELDAIFVFQVSTIIACVGIANVPFQALFITHEKFLTVAMVDIVNLFVKLLMVLVLLHYNGNALRFYAVGMSLTTFLSFIVYHYLAHKNWPNIIKWKFVRGLKNYKEMLVFNNYNLLATGSIVARDQSRYPKSHPETMLSDYHASLCRCKYSNIRPMGI